MTQPGQTTCGHVERPIRVAAAWGRRGASELDALDRSAYAAIAGVSTPALDRSVARLSDAADHSKLWLAGAAVLAAFGGDQGRRAAVSGVASIGVSSLVSNVLVKWVLPRRRPDRAGSNVPQARWVRMPTSRSFPSGHSASAFAFATAVSSVLPHLSAPVYLAAAAVACSRVYTGVHYPGDVIAGALLGTAIANVVGHEVRRLT